MLCELKAAGEGPRRAIEPQNVCLIERALQRAIAPVWRKPMKQFCLGIIVAIVLNLPAFGQGASLKEQLVGAWALVSCKSELPGASFCANPNGIFIIDATGHYAMVYAARGRPKTSAGRASPAEELKAVVAGAAANFGTWSFNEADKTITFHYDGALFPNPEGMDFKSTVSLFGNELKLDQDVLRRIKK